MKAPSSLSLSRQPSQSLNSIDWHSLWKAIRETPAAPRNLLAPPNFYQSEIIEAWLDGHTLARAGTAKTHRGTTPLHFVTITHFE